MFRRLWGSVLALVLVMASAAPALAAVTEDEYQSAARQLNKYGLVQGDDRGYRFYAQITRAEMAKLLVYALGMQGDAARYTGRGMFTDMQGHWADGVVAVAKQVGIMRGYPEGDFRPQAPLTYAEVITALSRLVGLEAGSEPWPYTYLGPASQAGIVPTNMDVKGQLNAAAPRGDVFVLLWRTLTEVKNAQGQNLLRRYLDTSAPAVVVDPQPKETTDPTLTISGTVRDAEQVLINGQPAAVSFGYFRLEVPLRIGPNTIRVQALDAAGNLREETISVTRKQGAVTAVALTGPAQVAAGQSTRFDLAVLDANGVPVADRKSLTAEVAPSALGTFDPTTGLFTAGTAVGTGSITVKSGIAQTRIALAVVAGPLENLKITPAVAEVAAKETAQFTVTGVDAYGNPVPVSGVQWSASSGSISAGGLYTAPERAGAYTVTAAAAGRMATAAVQPPNFRAASVRVSQPTGTLRANGRSEMTLTATVLDAQGKTLSDYNGSLTLGSSNASIAAPTQATVSAIAGVATFTVQAGSSAGTAQITATTNLQASGAATVTTTVQHLQSVRLVGTALSTHYGNRATGYVEAIALDEDGNPMRTALVDTVAIRLRVTTVGAGGNITFTQNGQSEAIIAVGPLDPTTGDVRTRTHLQYDAGVGTMLIEGTAVGTTTWVQVQSGALRADQVGLPARVMIEPLVDVEAGTPAEIYVVVLDENGYRVTQAAALANAVVKLKDENSIFYPVADAANGRYHFRVTQTAAGTHSYTALLQPARAEATAQGAVLPGPVDHLTLTADPATILADNASQTTLTAELQDAYGNRVTDKPYKVTFGLQVSRGATQPFAERVVTLEKGVAKVTVRAATAVNQDQYMAVVANPGGGNWTGTASVTTRGVPYRLALRYGNNDGNQTPGEPTDNVGQVGRQVAVYVDLLDRAGNVASYDTGRSVTLTARSIETGRETTFPAVRTVDGVAAFFITLPDAGTYALKAQANDVAASVTAGYGGGLGNLVIQPERQLHVRVAGDLPELRPNPTDNGGGSNYTQFTATLVDQNGMPQVNTTGRTLTVLLNIPGAADHLGTFTTNTGAPIAVAQLEIPNGASASAPVRFYSGTGTGTKTVTWTTQDGITSTYVVRTISAAAEYSLLVAAEPTPVSLLQSVTVTVRDANGKRVSSAIGKIYLFMKQDGTQVQNAGDAAGTWAVLDADRGQATFQVSATDSGAKLYAAEYVPPGASTASVKGEGTGIFTP